MTGLCSSWPRWQRTLACGGSAPPGVTLLALLFMVVRILAVLALPGMILARIGLVVFDARACSTTDSTMQIGAETRDLESEGR